MKHLGIDYGSKRVGVAVSDEAGSFAFPHAVLLADKNLVSELARIIKAEQIGTVVLGESRNYQGEPNKIQSAVEVFKKSLEEAAAVPVVFQKEFLSSAQAERIQGKHDKLDASAAAVILQSYLDTHGNKPTTTSR